MAFVAKRSRSSEEAYTNEAQRRRPHRTTTISEFAEGINGSPKMATQLQQLHRLFGGAAQLRSPVEAGSLSGVGLQLKKATLSGYPLKGSPGALTSGHSSLVTRVNNYLALEVPEAKNRLNPSSENDYQHWLKLIRMQIEEMQRTTKSGNSGADASYLQCLDQLLQSVLAESANIAQIFRQSRTYTPAKPDALPEDDKESSGIRFDQRWQQTTDKGWQLGFRNANPTPDWEKGRDTEPFNEWIPRPGQWR